MKIILFVLLIISYNLCGYCGKKILMHLPPTNYTENLCRQLHICNLAVDDCCFMKIHKKIKYGLEKNKIKYNKNANCSRDNNIYKIPSINGSNYLILFPEENAKIHMYGFTFLYFEFDRHELAKFMREVYEHKENYKNYKSIQKYGLIPNSKNKYTILYNYYPKKSKIKITYE
jgi:hypothetical protein